ncbi:alpha/beta hydrolase [Nocardia sp. NPDC058633]|uniref:alpha/beta hydrolase n=1 Tax=Nocardia sp. NPDC058633 TaxID=3346568 RepID=UPI003657CE04
MHFTANTSSNGVVERHFTLGEVTGALWSPAVDSGPTSVVLMGHGGGLHKQAPAIVARAHHFVTTCGFAVAAIDAPGHGGRARTPADEQLIATLQRARAAGEPIAPIIVEYNASLASRAVPEWRASIDALQQLPSIGADARIAYCGTALGTAIGIALTAADSRITAAVFGLLGHESLIEAAASLTVPLEFLLQWDDEFVDRHSALALFDAFGSAEKTLHANPGGHAQVPPFQLNTTTEFLIRHLGATA